MKRGVLAVAVLSLSACFNFDQDLATCQGPGGACADGGAPGDAGATDAGALDAGSDAGPVDAGVTDAGDPDAGPADAGDPDAGPDGGSDAGGPDCDGGVLACGECVPFVPGTECPLDGGVYVCATSGGLECAPLAPAPTFTASTDQGTQVTLSWTLPSVLPARWHLHRTGLDVWLDGGVTGFADAPGGGSMGAPTGLTATTTLGDRVSLSWQAPDAGPGPQTGYTLTAVTGAQASLGVQTSGWQAAPKVVQYVVTATRTSGPTSYDAGQATGFDDGEAERAVLTGTATATGNVPRGAVLLSLGGLTILSSAAVQTYTVQAISELGQAGTSAPANGVRHVDLRPTVQWLRTATDGGWDTLPDVTGEAWLDAQPPLATPLRYAAAVTTDGGTGFVITGGTPRVVRPTRHVYGFQTMAIAVADDGTYSYWLPGAVQMNQPGGFTSLVVKHGQFCGPLLDGGSACSSGTWVNDTYQAFAATSVSTCGLRANGTISCWNVDAPSVDPGLSAGTNLFSSLRGGDGTYAGVLLDGGGACFSAFGACQTPPGPYVDLAGGHGRVAGVSPAGTITVWDGYPTSGSPTPTLPLDAGVYRAVALSNSSDDSSGCGLNVDGGLRCWGSPLFQPGPSGPASEVALGYTFGCGLFDQRPHCWGYMQSGLHSLPPSGRFTQVSTGPYDSCGLHAAGAVECWGSNSTNQLISPYGAVAWPTAPQKQVVTTGRYSCSLGVASSAITCWGDSASIPVYGVTSYDSLAATPRAVCGLRSDTGKPECLYGPGVPSMIQTLSAPPLTKLALAELDTDAGTLAAFVAYGIGTDAGLVTLNGLSGTAPPATGPLVDLSCSALDCCAVNVQGALTCWGNPTALGAVPTDAGFVQVKVASSGTSPYESGPIGFACALSSDGRAHCFGTSPGSASNAVPPGRYVGLSGGYPGFCLLRDDGHVVCTGLDEYGQAPNLQP
jgi:hypothetical protein